MRNGLRIEANRILDNIEGMQVTEDDASILREYVGELEEQAEILQRVKAKVDKFAQALSQAA